MQRQVSGTLSSVGIQPSLTAAIGARHRQPVQDFDENRALDVRTATRQLRFDATGTAHGDSSGHPKIRRPAKAAGEGHS